MRILFVSTSTTRGGAEKTLCLLATLLDPKRFRPVSVVSLKPLGAYARQLASLGIPTTTLGMQAKPSLREIQELTRIIEFQKPDIVHAFMYQAIQLARIAKRRSAHRFKLMSSPRVNYRTRSFFTLMVDRVLKGSDDMLIAESEASRQHLIRKLRYKPEKVKTIYNGIDVAGWPLSKSDRQRTRLELRLESQETLIGAVGRLDEQKGHATLIDAMARLAKTHPARCVIIGDGPSRAALAAQIRRLKLEKIVTLLGEREDVTALLSSFDIFALPSLWEGLPNALLEAMALGLPVVASAVDGVPEVVADNESGLLVPPRQPVALAKRLSELVDDASLRARLGQQARRLIFERFNLPRMIGEYEAAYLAL